MLGSIVTAIIEIDCSPALLDTVAARLTRSAHAVTIEASTGRADLLLVTAGTADLASMSRFISKTSQRSTVVLATRTSIITRWFTEGGRWRLNALAPSEKGVLTTSENRTAVRARPTGISEQDRKVLTMLAYDGRTPMKELADAIGVSPAACKRQIDRLTSSGLVALRCEFARPLAGLPVLATLWCRVEPELLDTAGRVLSRAPEVRNCFAVVGADNLVVQLWLHSPAELDAFETRLRKEIPVFASRNDPSCCICANCSATCSTSKGDGRTPLRQMCGFPIHLSRKSDTRGSEVTAAGYTPTTDRNACQVRYVVRHRDHSARLPREFFSPDNLVGQGLGDDLQSFCENRVDHFLAAGDLIDQTLCLAGPPETAFDIAIAVHLFATACTAGQVRDVGEGCTPGAREIAAISSEIELRATRAVLWNSRKNEDGVTLGMFSRFAV